MPNATPNATTPETAPVKTRLIALTDWPNHHPWPPVGGLRHLVFHRKTNGFDRVAKKVRGRVLIDERAFFEWAAQQNDSDAE